MTTDYKSTVFLPKTEFPMRAGLPQRAVPLEVVGKFLGQAGRAGQRAGRALGRDPQRRRVCARLRLAGLGVRVTGAPESGRARVRRPCRARPPEPQRVHRMEWPVAQAVA